MGEIIKGTVEKWTEIKTTANGKFTTSVKIEGDDRYFGVFSAKKDKLENNMSILCEGSVIQFENTPNGNFNNMNPKTVKLITREEVKNDPGNQVKNIKLEPDWDGKERRKLKLDTATKVSGFFQLCFDQGLIVKGEIVDQQAYDKFYNLWRSKIDETLSFIYSTMKIKDILSDDNESV